MKRFFAGSFSASQRQLILLAAVVLRPAAPPAYEGEEAMAVPAVAEAE